MTDTYKQKTDAASPTAAPDKNLDTTANPAPLGVPTAWDENSARPLGFIGYFTTRAAAAHFGPDFLNEDACREWVVSRLHPGGAFCPGCGLRLEDDASFRAGKRCHCGRCGRWFTATTGTFLEGAHLDFAQVYALALFIELGHTPARISSMLGISADTVRLWMKKFRMLSHD